MGFLILSDTNLINTSNGRVQNLPVIDDESDDIYLYSISNNRHERLSKSSFGFPVNYLSERQTNMPSNRFPSIDDDGRHVYFSSDASGVGGLVFTNTNQEPDDDNDVRDVYHQDRKSTAVLSDDVDINMVYPNNNITHTFAQNTSIPVIIDLNHSTDNIIIGILRDDQRTGRLGPVDRTYQTQRWTGSFNAGDPGTHVVRTVVFNENFEEIGSSPPIQYEVSLTRC